MPDIGVPELLIIAVIVVLLFGPGKAADLGGALGKSIREFRKASNEPADGPANTNAQAGTEQPPTVSMSSVTMSSSSDQRSNGTAPTSSAHYCIECGASIGEAQKFCSSCGTRVAAVG